MNYDLVRELGDAGFKFKTLVEVDNEKRFVISTANSGYRVPTLEELIEKCGEKFYRLVKTKEGWQAWGIAENYFCVEGSTPKEAVTRLWLALNPKK